jgi:hypothetical protein
MAEEDLVLSRPVDSLLGVLLLPAGALLAPLLATLLGLLLGLGLVG